MQEKLENLISCLTSLGIRTLRTKTTMPDPKTSQTRAKSQQLVLANALYLLDNPFDFSVARTKITAD